MSDTNELDSAIEELCIQAEAAQGDRRDDDATTLWNAACKVERAAKSVQSQIDAALARIEALEHDSARTSALHEAAEMHERAYARTMNLDEKAWHQRMAEHLRWMADLEYT